MFSEHAARPLHSTSLLSLCVPPPTAATHSQIMLLHSLKKANYQLPLLITDSGVPPLSNNTEVKVQVCICKKNRMHCSSAHSDRANLLMLLVTVLLGLLCKYNHSHSTEQQRWGDVLPAGYHCRSCCCTSRVAPRLMELLSQLETVQTRKPMCSIMQQCKDL